MSEWRPIETAPKDGTSVLLGQSEAVFSGYWTANAEDTDTGLPGWTDGVYNRYDELDTYDCITHWMPLPEPPKP